MVFEHIENLKRIYTDQLVIVDDNRPELGRFQGLTGTVRTVNMSGRALVEFDGHNNIGWYDIDVDFLKLVDEPVHETETVSTPVPPAETPAPAAEATAAETAAPAVEEKTAPAAPAADAGSMSVADMLAAARASAAGESAPAAAAEESPAAAEEEPEAAQEEAPAAEEKPSAVAGDAQALKDTGDVEGMLKYCRDVDG